jgi:type VI secretion system protein
MASVAAHLGRMLSTRAGSVQTLPDYGLPDLNDMRLSLHTALSQARQSDRTVSSNSLRAALEHVRVVRCHAIGDPLRLSFAIEALLEVEGLRRQVSFSAQLDGSGQFRASTAGNQRLFDVAKIR